MSRNRHFILYDGRAMTDTDSATAIEAGIYSIEEAKASAPDYGGVACWSYREERSQLVDERFEFYGFPEDGGGYTIVQGHKQAIAEIERRLNA